MINSCSKMTKTAKMANKFKTSDFQFSNFLASRFSSIILPKFLLNKRSHLEFRISKSYSQSTQHQTNIGTLILTLISKLTFQIFKFIVNYDFNFN